MPLSDWVTGADGVPAPAQQQLLDGLGEMLDDLRPVALDRARSRMRWTAAEYGEGTSVSVTLEHRLRPDWTVSIQAGPSNAAVSWLSVHDEFDETDESDAYPWTSLVVENVAAILRGEYEVEQTTRLGRWYRTSIIDVSDPMNPERLHFTTAFCVPAALPGDHRPTAARLHVALENLSVRPATESNLLG